MTVDMSRRSRSPTPATAPDSPEPRSASACFEQGNAYQDLRQPDLAAASYREAIPLQRDHARAHSRLGIALLALDQQPQALANCLKATRLAPRLAEAWVNLGRVFNKL